MKRVVTDESDDYARKGCLGSYVEHLEELLLEGPSRRKAWAAALDGEAARELRQRVPLSLRRQTGAFFTSRSLADQLLADVDVTAGLEPIVDPAGGAGDLLVAAAERLPTTGDARRTLGGWGRRLRARELDPSFVRATRLRLALLATLRAGGNPPEPYELAHLLPNVRLGDGQCLRHEEPSILLLNPPYGRTAVAQTWGRGLISGAAVFLAAILEKLPPDTQVHAILPDVLRSGTNYREWRKLVEARLNIQDIKPVGQFDPWTDIDVFILRGTARQAQDNNGNQDWWAPSAPERFRLDSRFEVRVGTVVPHRDLLQGPSSPYIYARNLPPWGEYWAGVNRMQHEGRRFPPPFIAVRRTSRPQHGRRLMATLVHASEPVLVENHLLICLPRDGTVASCRSLLDIFAAPETTRWLDQRIRCRHLTVGALRELPICSF